MAKYYVNSGELQAVYSIPNGKPIEAAIKAYKAYSKKKRMGEYFYVSEVGFRDRSNMEASENGDKAYSLRKIKREAGRPSL
jgi:hypothetical protein